MTGVAAHLARVARWYASILFSTRPVVGLALFAATLGNPDLGLAALLCGHLTYAAGRLFQLPPADLEGGVYGTNGVLFGLFLGCRFSDPLLVGFLAASGSFVVCLLTRAFTNTAGHLRVPTCSYPFVLATMLVSHVAVQQEALFGIALHRPPAPGGPIEGPVEPPSGPHERVARELRLFVASVGAILFQTRPVWCLAATIALLASSRLVFLVSLAGFAASRAALALLPLFHQGRETLFGLNAILIAVSIGGTFLLPGLHSFLLMLLAQAGGLLVAFSLDAIARGSGAEFTALPFNLMVTGACLMLQGRHHGARPFPPALAFSCPEEAIAHDRRYHDRIFHRAVPVPFFGEWLIVQGFDGPETHREQFRYGVDFAAVDERRRRFRTTGVEREDFYAYGAPVHSPVEGTVALVQDGVADNPVGEIDLKEPWGNFVLIHSDGVYVGLYHLKKGSISVAPGQPVREGTPVGRLGNSGRCALPHLHFQLQLEPYGGAAGIPFLLQDVVVEDTVPAYRSRMRPEEGRVVREAALCEPVRSALFRAMGEEWAIEIDEGGSARSQTWRFSYTLAGDVVVSDGRGEIEYRVAGKSAEVLRFPSDPLSPLGLFAVTLADMPCERTPSLTWETALHGAAARRFLPAWKRLASWVVGELFSVRWHAELQGDETARASVARPLISTSLAGAARLRVESRFEGAEFRELRLFEGPREVLACRRSPAASPVGGLEPRLAIG